MWTPANVVDSDDILSTAARKLNKSNGWPIAPGYTYNAMIAPVTNYAIAGAIWYQGESNTGTAGTYHSLFSSMIKAWRQRWGKEFPFYYVQLAPFSYGNNLIGAQLREAQAKTLALPKTGMVVTTDLADDTADIHPRNKKDVGIRLANLALADTYKQPIHNAMSPLFESMRVDKNKAVVLIMHAGDGLLYKGKAITGFYIAGDDRVFHPAEASIDQQKIVVSSKAVKAPVAVRYAYSNTAIGNVFSKGGLPLSPFRTDNWE